jgi:putative transposase
MEFGIKECCEALGVSRSGYYQCQKRELLGKRAQADRALGEQIGQVFDAHKQRYGSPRVTRALRAAGLRCGENRVARSRPDQIWVSDITYVATREGWLYLAVILDLFSRLVVGWKLGESLEAALVVTALQTALARREPPRGLIFHSDQGCQYSSEAVRKPLTLLGAQLSMSARGNCYEECDGRSLLQHVENRGVSQRASLCDPGRGAPGTLRIHRALLQ